MKPISFVEMSVVRGKLLASLMILIFLVRLSVEAENVTLDFATTAFSLKLYKKMIQRNANSKVFAMSPFAVYQSLAMLKLGARHSTEDQLENALRLKLFESSHDKYSIKKLNEKLTTQTANPAFLMAQKLWLQRYFCTDICNNFIQALKKNYGADIGEVNFVGNCGRASFKINEWIRRKTSGKIRRLLQVWDVNDFSRLVLTSATYFKSLWKKPFDPRYTKGRVFNVAKDGRIRAKFVPMMTIKDRFRFTFDLDNQIIELPLSTNDNSMIIIQPREISGLESLEERLGFDFLSNVLKKLQDSYKMNARVTLPLFKIDTRIDLENSLKDVGIHSLFSPRDTDMSGITGFRSLYLNRAIHETVGDVSEVGVEVGVASEIAGEIAIRDVSIFDFSADRPFLFFILNKPTGTILLMGRVTDPMTV